MTKDRMISGWMAVAGLLVFALWAAFWGGVIYVAWHFVSKFW